MSLNDWHLDKKVPIALIVTLLLQAAFAIVWASRMSVEVTHIIEETERIRVTQERTNELLVQHTRQGAHDIAKHRIETLEAQVKVLSALLRTNRLNGYFPQHNSE
jgi:hypothetical protein